MNKVPDEKTVWFFRENLTNSKLIPLLFNPFIEFIEDENLILNEVKMVEASFTIAPSQQNTKDENDKIIKGEGDDLWNDNKTRRSKKI